MPDDGSGSANESLALLVELAEPDAFSARVQQAESTVTVQIPERCRRHPQHRQWHLRLILSAAQGIPRTPLWVTLATVLTALVAVA